MTLWCISCNILEKHKSNRWKLFTHYRQTKTENKHKFSDITFHSKTDLCQKNDKHIDDLHVTAQQAFRLPPWVGNLPESPGRGRHTSCQHSCQRRTRWVSAGEGGESWWSFLDQNILSLSLSISHSQGEEYKWGWGCQTVKNRKKRVIKEGKETM